MHTRPLLFAPLALLAFAVFGGCGVSTERPPGESSEVMELAVDVDESAPDDVAPPPPPPIVRSCVAFETRACTKYWTTRDGTVSVLHCIHGVETCTANGQSWTACGQRLQREID